MLTMTILWGAFVQGALARDLSGATTLSLAECLSTPASALPPSPWSIMAEPAAYGHSELSSGSVCTSLSDASLLLGVQGTAGGDWTDLRGVVQHRWRITETFLVGSMANASWSGASGFPPDHGLDLTIHARLLLDPTWSVVCGIDRVLQLHTRFQPPSQALRLGASWKGAVAASAQLTVSADIGAVVTGQVAAPISERVRLRGSFSTAPISLAIASQVRLNSIPILMEVRWVDHLGMRTLLAVDLP